MTQVISDIIGLDGYKLFEPNISILEQQELQSAAQAAQSSLQGEQEASNVIAEEGL
jgi:hypothetical protein